MLFRIFTTLIIILNLISCSKNEKIEYDNLKEVEDPIEIYKEGLEAFNTNDFLYASEKFKGPIGLNQSSATPVALLIDPLLSIELS